MNQYELLTVQTHFIFTETKPNHGLCRFCHFSKLDVNFHMMILYILCNIKTLRHQACYSYPLRNRECDIIQSLTVEALGMLCEPENVYTDRRDNGGIYYYSLVDITSIVNNCLILWPNKLLRCLFGQSAITSNRAWTLGPLVFYNGVTSVVAITLKIDVKYHWFLGWHNNKIGATPMWINSKKSNLRTKYLIR